MKKTLSLALSLLFICGIFASCSKEQTEQPSGEASTEAVSETANGAAADNGEAAGSYIDIYSLSSPSKEAALLLIEELDFAPLGFDQSFTLEKIGTFTDKNGDTRDLFLVSIRGNAIAVISDLSEKDPALLFNHIYDLDYPMAMYPCVQTDTGWQLDKENKYIPENFADAE